MTAITALRTWLRGRHYSRHLSRHELAWAAEQDDDPGDEWADTLHGMNQELTEEFAAAVCAPGCHEAEHRALVPLPAEPDGFWTWQPARATQTVNLPPWEMETDDGQTHLSRRGLRAASAAADVHVPYALVPASEELQGRDLGDVPARPGDHEGPESGIPGRGHGRRELPRWSRLTRAWSALFGPDPQNLPGPVPDETAPSGPAAAGEPVLEGVIIDTPPAPEPSPSLKADLARIDAEALAVITRIDALIAEERDALHAWSGQLELTGATA